MNPTLKTMIDCAVREAGMRRSVYPKRCHEGKMKPDKAQAEMAAMDAIVATLRKIATTPALLEAARAAGIHVDEPQMSLPL